MLLINALWLALVVCGTLLGAEQAQDSRLVKAIYAKIQAAHVMSNDPAKLTAQYAEGFWALAVEKEFVLDEQTTCMAVIGQRCLLAAIGNKVRVFDVKTGQKKDVASPHRVPITAMTHQADFDVITGDKNGVIKRWNIKTGMWDTHFLVHKSPIKHLAWIGSQRCVVSASFNSVRFWEKQGQAISGVRFKIGSINCLLPMDGWVAVGLRDGSVRCINADTVVVGHIAQRCRQPVGLARISPSKIAAQYDRGIHIIDIAARPITQETLPQSGGIESLASLEDELVCTQPMRDRPGRGRSVICRLKHGSQTMAVDSLELSGHVKHIAAPAAGNWCAIASEDADDARGWVWYYDKIYVVKRLGDEVEEKIDDEFVQWMNEPAVRPVVEKRPKKKKPWYACG